MCAQRLGAAAALLLASACSSPVPIPDDFGVFVVEPFGAGEITLARTGAISGSRNAEKSTSA